MLQASAERGAGLVDRDFFTLLDQLAKRKLIKPLTTQGHITDLEGRTIVYDARNAVGGSGSPLFGQSGRVIGVNYAAVPMLRQEPALAAEWEERVTSRFWFLIATTKLSSLVTMPTLPSKPCAFALSIMVRKLIISETALSGSVGSCPGLRAAKRPRVWSTGSISSPQSVA